MASIKKSYSDPVFSSGSLVNSLQDRPEYINLSLASHAPLRLLAPVKNHISILSNNRKFFEMTDKQKKAISSYLHHLDKSFLDSRSFLAMKDYEIVTLAKATANKFVSKIEQTYYESSLSSNCWKLTFNLFNNNLLLMGFEKIIIPNKSKNNENWFRSQCLRFRTNKFWRRKYRVSQARIIDHENIVLGHVSRKTSQLYVSNQLLSLFIKKRKRNNSLLESLEAVNQDGYSRTLKQLSDVSVSNPELKRNELMTRLRGMEEYADSKGLVAEFITLTCPSKYHRYSTVKRKGNYFHYLNTKYDEKLNPRHAQQYLNKQWQKIRAELKRRNINLIGVRVAEPHHDGTPHWHMLFFINKSDRESIREVFTFYALEFYGDEKGAKNNRVDFKDISKTSTKGKKQSAVGYIAKYIAKNLSFENKNSKNNDESVPSFEVEGTNAKNLVDRVLAWSSVWGIRQFQQIGGERITIWRQLRSLRGDSLLTIPDLFIPIHNAAHNSDYSAFIEESNKIEKIQIIRKFSHVDYGGLFNEDNSYSCSSDTGEVYFSPEHYGHKLSRYDRTFSNEFEEQLTPKIIGLLSGVFALITQTDEWVIRNRKVSVFHQEPKFDFEYFSSLGARSAPLGQVSLTVLDG